jgi:pimeloyl-ACP methyl ester carboxylesterase
VPTLRVELLEASHWVQMDAAEQVNELMQDFLRCNPAQH